MCVCVCVCDSEGFCCSVAKSFPTLWLHRLQHARLPYALLSPGACSDSCPMSWWCHSTILTSITPFTSCPHSFPAWGSYPMSQLFALGGQSIGASASASVLPINIQGWFPLGLTSLISLLFKGLSRVFSNTTVWKHWFFSAKPSLWSNSHIRTWPLENQSFDYRDFVSKMMSLLFNMLFSFVIAFLSRSKRLLISWLQSMSVVILEPRK